MSLKEQRPPHVGPATVGDLIRALQEYPEHTAVTVRTGTHPERSNYPGEPFVRPVTVAPQSNRNGPYVTL